MSIFRIPLLPLRDVVAFPGMTIPLFVGREKSINAIKSECEKVFLVAQKDPEMEDPNLEDLYSYGVVAKVKQAIVLHDKTIKILVEGESIAKLDEIFEVDGYLESTGSEMAFPAIKKDDFLQLSALRKSLISSFADYSKAQKKFSADLINYIESAEDFFKLSYIITTHLDIASEEKQSILQEFDVIVLMEKILAIIASQMDIIQAERKIRSRIKSQIEKNQKEYYLNEQMKAIQKELGDAEDPREEVRRFEEKMKKVKLSKAAVEKVKGELKKLKGMNSVSAEASVIRNYLDFILELPWGKKTNLNLDTKKAKEVLDESHFGMEKAKDRIYELLIQHKRVKKVEKAPVLCFHGSPGTGKTSLSNAAAKAMGIKVARISLGGVKDEADIRGHRRTYIGAMPGRILQAIKNAGSSTLLIILDEIGGIGQDWRGNPADALLEVLDPVQNKDFQDHYLEVGFDLSNVIFMATTNTLNLPPALVDRLEIIEVSGYTQEEKKSIVKKYIFPKVLKEYGLSVNQVSINDEKIDEIIRHYTYEAGVRDLERQMAKLARKIMRHLEENPDEKNVSLDSDKIREFLGRPVYDKSAKEAEDKVGVVNGLAYVSKREGQEGEILSIEAKLIPGGSGKVEFTGRLGDVMKESAQVAFKYLLSNSKEYDVDTSIFKENNIHLHLPAGATPKDGPSAGVAMFCAMLSAVKNKPLRADIAITGEISLHNVLKVGGIKEKVLAAYRHEPKIKSVYIPYDNKHDLEDVPEEVKKSLDIVLAKSVKQVVDGVMLKS